MKTLFISAKRKYSLNIEKISKITKTLPKNLAIFYSIQFKDLAFEIKELLSKSHKIISFSQVLGCSNPKLSSQIQAVLLVGSGKFHAISLATKNKTPTYILEQNNLYQISKKDLEDFEKKQKISKLKFLNAEKIGVLVSTKPGQENLNKAIEFKKKSKKKTYLFLANNINSQEFENFQIDSFVNTACPRLDLDDSRIINLNDLEN